jgi:methyltransferase (TIGR00027 family)
LRYAKPGVRWFEVDHPSTQQDKLRRLAALGIDIGHICFIPADFDTDDLASRLLDAGLVATRASIFLLEGVAVYLERATLESVLNQMRAVAGPGSLLAISLSVTGGSAVRAARRAALGIALAALGEPTRSAVGPDEVQGLLAGAGWHPVATTATDIGERSRAAGLVLATAL